MKAPRRPRETSAVSSDWACPIPLQNYPRIVLGHGGGGKLSGDLVEHLFLPAFQNETLEQLGDAAVLPISSDRIAITTDTFVVQPLFFPGGSIGELAVNGTVNDLAMRGAIPLYLTVAFVLEEGFPVASLQRVVDALAAAARHANVNVVAGDTKVVERGHGDGCYINTTGVGVLPPGIDIGPQRARVGDTVVLSGTLGDHGMAVMSVREALEFESEICSDTASLAEMVANMIRVCPRLRVLRDPTRGGLASSLNEIARSSSCGIVIDEAELPVRPAVRAACDLLGLDPLQVANEGKLVCVAPSESLGELLQVMRADPCGRETTVIGRIVAEHPGRVVAKTAIGASRVVPLPVGEQLPRIC